MKFSTQASALFAALCLSAPALASMVNGAPIPVPEPMGLEARNPSWVSTLTDGLEDVSKVGNAVGDAGSAVGNAVNAGESLWDDVFGNNAPAATTTAAPQ
jgi:hypothetical protein